MIQVSKSWARANRFVDDPHLVRETRTLPGQALTDETDGAVDRQPKCWEKQLVHVVCQRRTPAGNHRPA